MDNDLRQAIEQYNDDVRIFNDGIRDGSINGAVRVYWECDLNDDLAEIRARLSEVRS